MANAAINNADDLRTAEDDAAIDGLSSAVQSLLPALERFTRFDQPERTASERAVWSAQLDEPLPKQGAGADAVLKTLSDVVIPHGLRIGSPGFSGWIATMPTMIPAAAHLASAIAGPLIVGVQSFNLLEALALRWLAELLNLPASYQGLFTSGGAVANLICLGAARQHAAEQRGSDPALHGIASLPNPRIYTTSQVHHSIYRAGGVLGLGRQAVVTIPTDEALRMDVAALRRQIAQDRAAGCTPIAVVANAGTTNTGAIDPLPEIIALCREQDIWLHADGAYGLFGVLDPAIAHLYGDLSMIDSMVIDPHKWLATSMGCGGLFVRDAQLLARAFRLEEAGYVEGSLPIYTADTPLTSQLDDFGYMFQGFGIEHTLPSRGVEVWAVLKEIGADGIKARVCRHNAYARYLAERIQETPELELVAPVTLSTCCFRYVPEALRSRTDQATIQQLNTLNRSVLGRMRARGRSLPSATVLGSAFVIRSCFINPRTTLADIEAVVEEAVACGAEAWAAMNNN
ncbi:MAG TPA: aminotransferase class V-fold PLP-dependent enzyme [Herpetosiphonaceae bacterium]